MTAVREGVSGGSTNTRRAGRLVPPNSIGQTAAAAARVSPVSSPTRSKASLSRTAWCDANPEASADRSPGSLTHHRSISPYPCIRDKHPELHGGPDAPSSVASLSASSPACSKVSRSRAAACDATDPKPESEIEGSAGRNTHKISATGGRQRPHGSEVVSSSVAPSVGKEQRRLLTRVDSAKSSAILENIRLQKTRQPSQLQRGVGADSDWRDPQVSGKKNEVSDHRYCQTDTVSSRISSVEEANQEPRRSIHKAASAVPKDQTRSSQNCHQRVSEIDAINGWRFPKVSKEEDKLDEHECQTAMLSHTSSARDSKLELVDAFEDENSSAKFKKPLAMSPHEPIRFHFLRRPPVLDRRGALDAISESRLVEGHIPTTGFPKQELSSASTSKSNSATLPLGNGKLTIASSACTLQTWEGETYITTLGPGGGYGYPHPPPFYRCEVCLKKTAFYRLKCCHMVVCECCGCRCEPAEIIEDKKSQYQRKKVKAVKEQLPKVKLDGADLFLWQPCSFPRRLMLCMAKRTGNNLQYYFATVDQLMDQKVDLVDVCVYDFRQQGHDVISLSKTKQRLACDLLC